MEILLLCISFMECFPSSKWINSSFFLHLHRSIKSRHFDKYYVTKLRIQYLVCGKEKPNTIAKNKLVWGEEAYPIKSSKNNMWNAPGYFYHFLTKLFTSESWANLGLLRPINTKQKWKRKWKFPLMFVISSLNCFCLFCDLFRLCSRFHFVWIGL